MMHQRPVGFILIDSGQLDFAARRAGWNGMQQAARIIVDADACPVKREIVQAALPYGIQVVMVASFDHYIEPKPGVEVVQVDRSDQSVDLYISNFIRRGDILVTQDFGLATIGLAKQAIAMSVRGQLYTDQTIDFLLETRHHLAKKRRSGQHSKGPRAFTQEDRNRFLRIMSKVLDGMQENELT